VAVLAENLRIASGQSAPFGLGGDFFEVAVDASGCVSIVLADVCGNGPDAAAFVPDLRAVARAQLARGQSPAIVLAALNQWLASAERAMDRFATGLALRIDPRSGRVEIAGAGHLGPFVKTACGAVHALSLAGGVALGIWPGQRYHETAVRLAPGDGLILATDGVTDALASADDTLGQLGLIERLRRATPGDGKALCATLLRLAEAGEDATVIVVERGWSPVAGAGSFQERGAPTATAHEIRRRVIAN
jgi:serine phosphatase RsbU (regulator of sigma subunit)